MRTRFALCSVLLFFTSCSILSAQTITGSVTGTVTDAGGAAVGGAKVTATNIDTGVQTDTVTNEAGVYTIRFLQIGHYKLNFSAQGFSPSTAGPFSLEVSQELESTQS